MGFQFLDGHLQNRVNEMGRQFAERVQNEISDMQKRVGELQPRLVYDACSVEEKVQVDPTGAPSLLADAAHLLLDPEQLVHHFCGRKAGLNFDDLIEEVGLVRFSPGLGPVDLGYGSNGPNLFGYPLTGPTQLFFRGILIGSQANVDGFHEEQR